MPKTKPSVFISHAVFEADIIHKFVEQLKIVLPNVSFFVSSSYDSLNPGDIWWDEIRQILASAKIILACVSRQSIGKPWILFESGVGVGSKALLIPVILDDLPFSELGLPLSMFQSIRLDQVGLVNLVELISKNTATRINNKHILSEPMPRFTEIPISIESSIGIYSGKDRYDITSGWQRYTGNHQNLQIRTNGVSIGESFSDGFRYPPSDSLNAPWKYFAFRIKRSQDVYFYAVLRCLDGSTPKIFVSSVANSWGFSGDPTDEYRVPIDSTSKGRWQVIVVNVRSLERDIKSPVQAITGFRVRGPLLLSHIWCVDNLAGIPDEFLESATVLSYPGSK
jgi:hypothetical protein